MPPRHSSGESYSTCGGETASPHAISGAKAKADGDSCTRVRRHLRMWARVDIAGKPAEVFDPPGGPRFGLIHLHGVGEETYADKPVFTRLLGELRLGCVCPRG